MESVHHALQRMVDKLGIRFGAMNVELVVDRQGRVWPIDVGPRNGGNMIPDLLGMIFDVDVVELSVKAAMGEEIALSPSEGNLFYATHNLHSDKNGRFDRIEFSKEIERHIVRKCIYKKLGDAVEYFDNAAKALGIVFMKFEDGAQMDAFLSNIYEHITVCLQ